VLGRDRFGNEQLFTATVLQGMTFRASFVLREGTVSAFTEQTEQQTVRQQPLNLLKKLK
jgi:hypothetical protein